MDLYSFFSPISFIVLTLKTLSEFSRFINSLRVQFLHSRIDNLSSSIFFEIAILCSFSESFTAC